MVARNLELLPHQPTNITVIAPNRFVAEKIAEEHKIIGEPRWRWREVRSVDIKGTPRKSDWYTITDGDTDQPIPAA